MENKTFPADVGWKLHDGEALYFIDDEWFIWFCCQQCQSHVHRSSLTGEERWQCEHSGPSKRPECPDCTMTMTPRDKAVFECEGGTGWPRICEDCAEL